MKVAAEACVADVQSQQLCRLPRLKVHAELLRQTKSPTMLSSFVVSQACAGQALDAITAVQRGYSPDEPGEQVLTNVDLGLRGGSKCRACFLLTGLKGLG